MKIVSPVFIDIQTRADPNQEALFYEHMNVPDDKLSPAEIASLNAQAAVEYIKYFGFWHLLQDEFWWTSTYNRLTHKTAKSAMMDVRKAFVSIRNEAALMPELAAITCLSYWNERENGGVISGATTSPNDPNKRKEADLIGRFNSLVSNYSPLVIWSSWTLDVILGRMGVLNIKPAFVIDRRPWGQDIVDLSASRWVKGFKSKSLVWTAQALGIPIGATNTAFSGEEMPGLWENEYDIVMAYSKERVALTRAIFERWSGIFFQSYQIDPGYNQTLQDEYASIVQNLPVQYRR